MARIEESGANGSSRSVVRGIAAGAGAALVMGIVAMIVSSATGRGFWTPLMLIGATYLGLEATRATALAAVLGMGTHVMVGAVFGLLFVPLTRKVATREARVAAGLAYGASIYLFMTFFVLPWANPVMYASIDLGRFFLYHLVYGLVLPLALPAPHGWVVPRRDEAR